MSKWLLAFASGAAFVASTCCLLPLLLVALGASGLWMSSLRIAQPYSTAFALLSAALLVLCWRQMLLSTECADIGSQECRPSGLATRVIFWCTTGLTALMLSSPAWAPLFY